jgi:hypothetical protein
MNNYLDIFETDTVAYTTQSGISASAEDLTTAPPKLKKRKKNKKLPSNIALKKNEILFKKILFRYHPSFMNAEAQHQVLNVLGPDAFNVEHLIEQAFAHVGGYNFVDEDGYDFDDAEFSDSKTVTVNKDRSVAELGSVGNKIGTLRIVVYNPFIQDVHFLYMQYKDWQKLALDCHGKNKGDKRLMISYSFADMHYNQFRSFQVDSFEILACRMDSIPASQNALPVQGLLF